MPCRKRVDEGCGVPGEQHAFASGSHRAVSQRADRSPLSVESNIVDDARAAGQLVRESHQLLAKARAGSNEMRPVMTKSAFAPPSSGLSARYPRGDV